jgi:hypothetical protein
MVEPLTYKYVMLLTYDQRSGMFDVLRLCSMLINQPSYGQKIIDHMTNESPIDDMIKGVTMMH